MVFDKRHKFHPSRIFVFKFYCSIKMSRLSRSQHRHTKLLSPEVSSFFSWKTPISVMISFNFLCFVRDTKLVLQFFSRVLQCFLEIRPTSTTCSSKRGEATPSRRATLRMFFFLILVRSLIDCVNTGSLDQRIHKQSGTFWAFMLVCCEKVHSITERKSFLTWFQSLTEWSEASITQWPKLEIVCACFCPRTKFWTERTDGSICHKLHSNDVPSLFKLWDDPTTGSPRTGGRTIPVIPVEMWMRTLVWDFAVNSNARVLYARPYAQDRREQSFYSYYSYTHHYTVTWQSLEGLRYTSEAHGVEVGVDAVSTAILRLRGRPWLRLQFGPRSACGSSFRSPDLVMEPGLDPVGLRFGFCCQIRTRTMAFKDMAVKD